MVKKWDILDRTSRSVNVEERKATGSRKGFLKDGGTW